MKPNSATTHDADDPELDLHRWQVKALSIILIVVAVTGLPAYATVIVNAIRNRQMTLQVWLYLVIYLASVGLALFPRLDFRLRSIGLFALTYTNAVTSFTRLGLVGSGRLWLVVMPIIATIVVGSWAGYAALALGLLIYAAFALLAQSGVLGGWITLLVNPLTLDYWIEGGAALVIFLVTMVILVDRFHALQARTLAASRRANVDLKQAARSLRESEERYRTLVGASPDGIAQTDLEGRILFASPQLMRLFDLTDPGEIVNTSVLEWIAPEDRERAWNNVRRAIQGDSTSNNSYTFLRSGGAPFSVEVNSAPWCDAAGQTRGMISIVRDVTERVQTQAALRDKTLELERFFDCALDLLCIADTDGRFLRLNREWEKVLGYPLEKLEGQRLLDLVHPDDMASTLAAMSELGTQRAVLNFVNRYRCQDGSYRWIEWRSFPFGDKIYAAARDITERKRAQAELERTQQLLDAAFEQSPVPMVLVTMPNMVLRYVNSAAARFLAIQAEEYRMRSLLEVAVSWKELKADGSPWEISEQQHDLPLSRALRGIETKELELELLRADGQRVWELVSGAPIWAADGTLLAGLLVMQDITARKQVEDDLRETSTRLTLATRAGGVGVWDYDIDQNLLVWDDQMYALYGISRDTFGGDYESWRAGLHPEDIERGDREVQMALRGEKEFDTEFRVVWPDGSVHHIRAQALVVRAVGGAPQHMIGINWDITERKRAERLLQTLNVAALAMQQALHPEAIFNAVSKELQKIGFSCVIFATDAERQHLIVKHRSFSSRAIQVAERVTGHRMGSARFPVHSIDVLRQAILEKQLVFVQNTEAVIRQQLPAPFNRLARLLVSVLQAPQAVVAPLVVEDEVIGLLTVQAHDLFESDMPAIAAFAHQMAAAWRKAQLFEQAQQEVVARQQAEQEVRRLNEELEQRVVERTAQLEAANKELEAFSYSVSHDLRAPLRAIDGYTRILVEDYQTSLDAEGRRVCAVVRNETRRMGQLIDDLLAFSRLSRAAMQPAPIDMERLVRAVFDELAAPADKARIDLRVDPLPPAMGDPALIRQVWLNLLSNAVKFSSKRERALIRISGKQSGGETVYSVHDDGAGFDMEYVDKLFGVFQRLHSEREFEGTGVGLAIVQRVIHRHGGRVWAEGQVDQGATFYFTLPQKGGRP